MVVKRRLARIRPCGARCRNHPLNARLVE